jgi:mannose-6-phosphate isomerase-like protein (cupin superfamily)
MRGLFVIALLLSFVLKSHSQVVSGFDTIGRFTKSENIYSRKVSGDSLSTTFCILIKKEVKAHKHIFHSENVLILEGEGLMKLDGKIFAIKKGDVIFISKNATHSVKTTGKIPLKVLSIQSPAFDGSDRVFVEEK